ncbi:tetraprenyl-beta-curcumene synthase [Desulfitispora alkaliphila]|uniref:tetraprenyl-beta-curcumene synthase family protein n=1 Tax=Desulfitispora alkaliphila TaxID=622674 RepID=UPI003D257720
MHLLKQILFVSKFVKDVFPKVDNELDRWAQLGAACPDTVLADQAMASIRAKKFHCQGGSVYALHPQAHEEHVSFIVALQTISDYLDNLCDRVGFESEEGFRQLHNSFLDAVDIERTPGDYYAHYPHNEDGGYLKSLVHECRSYMSKLPSYGLVKEHLLFLAELYCDLQTYKHLHVSVRENYMEQWIEKHQPKYPDLLPYEFAAATGSTLGIFMLTAAASNPNLTAEEANKIKEAYFPWICGLHILLDYYIDQEEDQKEGDLNFVFYYNSSSQCHDRLEYFVKRAKESTALLPEHSFHNTVVEGLLGMYLSDPKVATRDCSQIIKAGGSRAKLLHRLCKILRYSGKL